jgi:UDP-galactopyranose mutase
MIFDILCFSHLRWNFVYQRPQHLFSRFGKRHRVIFFEEPEFGEYNDHYSLVKEDEADLFIITPRLFHGQSGIPNEERLRKILDTVILELSVQNFIAWYYTPMALLFSDHLEPELVVYDCMDELSAFKNAPERLLELENTLFTRADVVFTGGYSLYEHKKEKHHAVFPCPSSIDKDHFYKSRKIGQEPEEQSRIPSPKFGFYGVIDERFDISLLDSVARMRPSWNFVIIGPVVKINPTDLPRHSNIHYLGQRSYQDLPAYLSGWDVAIMPFALNESTKYISPTKTPEFLAGGKPVISTSIRDVVKPYGELGLVEIADNPESFVRKAEFLLSDSNDRTAWLKRTDEYLSELSWDKTWSEMYQIMIRTLMKKIFINPEKNEAYV